MIAGHRARPEPLPRPIAGALVAGLLVCAAAAWAVAVRQSTAMGQMGGPTAAGAGVFLATWLAMMVAMMFPAVVPVVLAHAAVVRARGGPLLTSAVFVAGYLAVWTAAGVGPLLLAAALGALPHPPPAGWLPAAAGAVIAAAGLYQLAPAKQACLRACRSPIRFVLEHDFGGGPRAAVRAGIAHGAYCLGCCWGLMAVLAVVGLMNLAWMAVLAALLFLEKTWRHGVALSRVAAAGLVLVGGAVLVDPGLLMVLEQPFR